MNKEFLICRCRKVSEQEIRQAIAEGAYSVAGIKRSTGAGRGQCQGQICRPLIIDILSGLTGIPAHIIEADAPRLPIRLTGTAVMLILSNQSCRSGENEQ